MPAITAAWTGGASVTAADTLQQRGADNIVGGAVVVASAVVIRTANANVSGGVTVSSVANLIENVTIGSATDSALRALLKTKAENTITKLTGANSGSYVNAALAHTAVNFNDPSGTPAFANDAAVAAAAAGGIGPASLSVFFAFSGSVAHPDDGHCISTGGGHADGGDSSIFGFNVQSAALFINSGGASGSNTWTLRLAGASYRATTDARPSAGDSPIGNAQDVGSPAIYWTGRNNESPRKVAPMAQHGYHHQLGVPGTNGLIWLMSGGAGYSSSASSRPNLFCIWDESTSGGLQTFAGTSAFADTESRAYGYAQSGLSGQQPMGFSYNPFTTGTPNAGTGDVWSPTGQSNFGSTNLVKITNPLNSSLVFNGWGATTPALTNNPSATDGVIIKDPANTNNQAYFMHGQVGGGTASFADTNFILYTGLNSAPGNVVAHTQTYSSSVTTNDGLDYTYDTTRNGSLGVIWAVDLALALFKITPNASLSSWTIEKITPGGDTLVITSGPVTPICRTTYIPSQDCLIITATGDVGVYKPVGWNPPAETGSGGNGINCTAAVTCNATVVNSSAVVGSATVTAPVVLLESASAAPSASATVTVTALLREATSASLSAVATTSVSVTEREAGTSSLSGVAVVSSNASVQIVGSAPISGSAVLLGVTPHLVESASSAASGSATVSTIASQLEVTSTVISGTASIFAKPDLPINANLLATATVTATAQVLTAGAAVVSGAAAVAGVPSLIEYAFATVAGSATGSSTASQQAQGVAHLAAAAAVSATVGKAFVVAVALTGGASVLESANLLVAASAAISGNVVFSATCLPGAGLLSGNATVTANASVVRAASATLVVTTSLSVTPTEIESTSPQVSSTALVTATTTLRVVVRPVLAATVVVTARFLLEKQVSAALSPTAQVSAFAGLGIPNSSALAGAATVSAQAQVVIPILLAAASSDQPVGAAIASDKPVFSATSLDIGLGVAEMEDA